MPEPTSRRALLAPAGLGLGLAAAASWGRFWAAGGSLALDTRAPAWLIACAVAGLGLLCASVTALREAPPPRQALRLGLWLQLCAAPALALTSSDLFSNLAYGALLVRGQHPGLVGPSALGAGHPLLALVPARWAATPSAYGPPIAALQSAAALVGQLLGSPVWGSLVAFKLLLLGCALATLLLAAAAAHAQGTPAASQGLWVLAASPLFAWEISAQAHNDGLMVCTLAAFAWAACTGRDALAAAALAVGAVAKLACAPLLAIWLALVARRSPRRAGLLGLLALAVAALCWAPLWRGWATLQGPAAAAGADLSRHAHSLHDLLDALAAQFRPAARAPLYRTFQVASLAWLVAGTVWACARARTLRQAARGWTVLLLGYFLLTPWFQPWYASWLLPTAVLETDARWQRLVAFYAVISVVQWAAPLDPVTTVLGNGWVVWQLIRLRRPVQPAVLAAGPTPATAAAPAP